MMWVAVLALLFMLAVGIAWVAITALLLIALARELARRTRRRLRRDRHDPRVGPRPRILDEHAPRET